MGLPLLIMIEKNNHELHLEIQTARNKRHAQSEFLRGRQILRMLYDFVKTHPLLHRIFGMQDICKMTYKGDHAMHEFYHHLQDVIDNRSQSITDDAIRDTLWNMLEGKSTELKDELKEFEKAMTWHMQNENEPRKPEFTFKFLMTNMKKYLDKKHQKANQAIASKGHGKGDGRAQFAA